MKNLRNLARVWALCKPYQRYILQCLGLILLWHSISAFSPILLGKMVTGVTDKNTSLIAVALTGWLILSMARASINWLREWVELKYLDFDLSRHIADVSMKKFFSISMGQHFLGHSVIKRTVISKGEAAVVSLVWQLVYELLPTSLNVILPTAFLLVNVPLVGLSVVVAMMLFGTYTVHYNLKFVPRIRKLDTIMNRAFKRYGEVTNNAEVVYVHAQEERVRRECDIEVSKNGEFGRPVWMPYHNYFYLGQWMIWIMQAFCIGLAAYLAVNDRISKGMFVTVILWISSSIGTLTNISHIQRNFAKNIAPIAKYFRFLDYEPDIVMPLHPVPIDRLQGQIEFRYVSFTYSSRTAKDALNDEDEEEEEEKTSPAEIAAIKDVSFMLEAGKRYAFVGRSGAGKSTMVNLILRAFDPQKGQILVDGVDLSKIDYRELRRRIGLVPQDVALFDGTVRYNVTFGLNGHAEDVTTEELDSIAKLSRISEFSDKLEKGWDTMIGERGIKLSGGQRQRVGIARALIKEPQILIFDEATSSLDTENEACIRESIREASVGKTTIIIAHRLATVKDADEILLFDEGCLVGKGPHKDLLSTNEFYQRLVQNQVIMA